MDKQHILDEIKRTAAGNGGQPLGHRRFRTETGIKESDWRGKYWENFGDAQEEAGFERNIKTLAHDDNFLLEKLIGIMRELTRYPTVARLRMKRRADPDFPGPEAFERFGKTKLQRIEKIQQYCRTHTGYEDVLAICTSSIAASESKNSESDSGSQALFGFVYLMKSGRYYKIGKTSHVGGRERDLAIQLPDRINTVHSIRTDDPTGIEAYWHNRFQDRRKNGEWFNLTADDINAFKRRKFM